MVFKENSGKINEKTDTLIPIFVAGGSIIISNKLQYSNPY